MRRVHIATCIESISYLCMGCILLWLLLSKEYLHYVTPKVAIYLWFTTALFFVWAITAFTKLYRKTYHISLNQYFVLIIPIVLLLSSKQHEKPMGHMAKLIDLEYQSTTINLSDLPGIDTIKRQIDVEPSKFHEYLTAIEEHKNEWEGYQIRLEGRVYKDTELSCDNSSIFAIVRYVMSCCSADVYPYGILCYDNKNTSYGVNDWIQVEGVLRIKTINEKEEAIIEIITSSEKEPPREEYIYNN